MIKLIKIKDQGWKIQICDKRGAFSLNIWQQKPFKVGFLSLEIFCL